MCACVCVRTCREQVCSVSVRRSFRLIMKINLERGLLRGEPGATLSRPWDDYRPECSKDAEDTRNEPEGEKLRWICATVFCLIFRP